MQKHSIVIDKLLFSLFRAAKAARIDESDFWRVQPAARYFFLGEKVPKTPSKGFPLRYPHAKAVVSF